MQVIMGMIHDDDDVTLHNVHIPETPIPVTLDFKEEIGRAIVWREGRQLIAKINLDVDVLPERWQAILGYSEETQPFSIGKGLAGADRDRDFLIGGAITSVALLSENDPSLDGTAQEARE